MSKSFFFLTSFSVVLFILLLTNTTGVLAQSLGWQSIGGGLIYTSGKVGVGTDDPKTVFSLNKQVGGNDVGITQNQMGGWHTFEATTADAKGEQATRLLLRGSSNDANVEFYSGARGSERLNAILTGSGDLGIGESSPQSKMHVSGGNGPVKLILEADEDNNVETDQPSIYFSQDGGKKDAELGYFDGKNDFSIRNSNKGGAIVLFDDGRICIGNC